MEDEICVAGAAVGDGDLDWPDAVGDQAIGGFVAHREDLQIRNRCWCAESLSIKVLSELEAGVCRRSRWSLGQAAVGLAGGISSDSRRRTRAASH